MNEVLLVMCARVSLEAAAVEEEEEKANLYFNYVPFKEEEEEEEEEVYSDRIHSRKDLIKWTGGGWKQEGLFSPLVYSAYSQVHF